MTPQERDIIGGIFERMRPAATAPRDPEVERFISDQIRQQPHAPYVMAQSIYAMEQALTASQQQIEQLQAQVQQMQSQAQQPRSGGFLSGLFGGGSQPPAPAPMQQRAPFQRGAGVPQIGMAPQQPAGPWGGQPQPAGPWGQQGMQPQQRGGMGFLGTAAAAAVGVAGGMMVANALQGAFAGPGGAQTAAADPAAAAGAGEMPANAEAAPYEDPATFQEASYDQGGGDFGGDFGGDGGGDWA
jgi:hypothetical protein